MRIFRNKKPIVAAVHGAAIGGGLGLAVSADFRVTCPEARFAANFTKLGFHPGFGLTATLPELVGKNNAELIFYTSRRVTGEEAYRMGLANVCVPQDQVRAAAMKLAQEIAECSPLGLLSTRATMRAGLADRVLAATNHELAEQTRLRATEDFKEGVKATAERRRREFQGAVRSLPVSPCGRRCPRTRTADEGSVSADADLSPVTMLTAFASRHPLTRGEGRQTAISSHHQRIDDRDALPLRMHQHRVELDLGNFARVVAPPAARPARSDCDSAGMSAFAAPRNPFSSGAALSSASIAAASAALTGAGR